MNTFLIPVITEKSMADAKIGKFTFKTRKNASKDAIKEAAKRQYAVDVVSVSTTIVKGRTRRFGKRRLESQLAAWKKTIVKLKAGQKIDAFEVATE